MTTAPIAVPTPPLLEVRNLGKSYRAGSWFRPTTFAALRDVSFALPRGAVLAVVGESGSGKSTIARLVARLVPRTTGEIRLDGVDVTRTEPRRASLAYRRRVQMIFQDPFGSLNPASTIAYHVERPLQIHRLARTPAERAARTRETLATVGVEPTPELLAKYPHQLSGGQRQRIAIARAIACEPEVVLADEPTSMLDVSIRIGILNLLDRLRQTRGLSLVYITHDVASARYLGGDILVMYAGIAVERGPADEVTERPRHPYTQLLLSAVPGSVHSASADATPRASGGGRVVTGDRTAPGCPFAARCPHVMPECRTQMPAPEGDATHWVRCHLVRRPS